MFLIWYITVYLANTVAPWRLVHFIRVIPCSDQFYHAFFTFGEFSGLDKRKTVGAPPTIPMSILNTMRMHIKVQQVSKQGQASGEIIQSKLVASVIWTEHERFCGNWAWRRIRELWPDKITPGGVLQQDSIQNKWTTFKKVNYWYKYNKKTLIDISQAVDKPTMLPDGTIAEITMDEDARRRKMVKIS